MRSAERFSYSQKLILSEIDIFNSAFPHFRSHTKLTNSCSLDNENVGSFKLFRSCWRKRSIPTHLERHNPPTIIAKMGLKRA